MAVESAEEEVVTLGCMKPECGRHIALRQHDRVVLDEGAPVRHSGETLDMATPPSP